MQGRVTGGNQVFNQYTECPLHAITLAMLYTQQLERQSEAAGNRLFLYGYPVLLLVQPGTWLELLIKKCPSSQ